MQLFLWAHPFVPIHTYFFLPNKHFTCFTTFCLFAEIYFYKVDKPGILSLATGPRGLVARIHHSHCRGLTSISGWGTEILLQAAAGRGHPRSGPGESGMTSQMWRQPSSPITESILLNSPFQLHYVLVLETFWKMKPGPCQECDLHSKLKNSPFIRLILKGYSKFGARKKSHQRCTAFRKAV